MANAIINVVTDFSADNTGTSSCYTAIRDALNQVITNGGGEVYFPQGIYKIKAGDSDVIPIRPSGNINKVKLFGEGAVIICDTDDSEVNYNGSGGGFMLIGDSIIIEGLRFEGYVPSSANDTNHTNGRLLKLSGNNCVVKNCYFKNGNGGAVEFDGCYNVINGNVFENCNNHSDGTADYGAISIFGSGTAPYFTRYNTISENKIFGQYQAGISAYGSSDANCYVSYLDIINNYIRSASSSVSNNHSMGIYLLQGANTNIKIIGNTIEHIDVEGIIMASDTNYPASQCIIANNIIHDCDFRGISLEIESSGGTYRDITITGNIIENTSAAPHYSHHMWLEAVSDSIISNNKCVGVKNGSSYVGQGIVFYNSCPRNLVSDNQARTLSVGIIFSSPDGALKDNHIYDCDAGISLAYCLGSSIVGNIINRCVTGILYGTSSATLHIVANAILECTNQYGGSGPIAPEVMTLSGRADGGSNYSRFIVTGTLSGGAAVVTFYHVYTGDRFLVLPANQSGTGVGAMYVSLIDVLNSQVFVKSTDTSDSRDFMLIKVVSGG